MGDLEKDKVKTDGANSVHLERTEFICLLCFVFLQENNDLKIALGSNE